MKKKHLKTIIEKQSEYIAVLELQRRNYLNEKKILIEQPNSLQATIIKGRYKISMDLEKAVWQGSVGLIKREMNRDTKL